MDVQLPASTRVPGSRTFAVVALGVAGWPVLHWYVLRLHDHSDEPFGLLALAAALVFLPRTGWSGAPSGRRWLVAASLMAGYAVLYAWLPPLAHALLWLGAVAALVAPRSYAVAWSALLVLALPFVATVQFYLGYPMRCLTTQLAAAVLRAGGLHVAASGTVLNWAGERVLIDAPCAGIQMLWTLLLATAVLAAARRLGGWQTARLFRWAAAAVFGCNTVRAVVLFLIEMKFVPPPPLGHEGVGLVLFAFSGVILLWRTELESREGRELRRSRGGAGWVKRLFRFAPDDEAPVAPRGRLALPFGARACFCAASLGAASVPWIHTGAESRVVAEGHGSPPSAFPGWSAAPIPPGLGPVALSAREERFARDFPGRIAAFTDGTSTWVVRWVQRPTRKLHPAADCLRGAGYAVTPGAASTDKEGALWAGCTAVREGKTLRSSERIFGPAGTSWTDVSAWYWHALLGHSAGPWWAVTRLQPAG